MNGVARTRDYHRRYRVSTPLFRKSYGISKIPCQEDNRWEDSTSKAINSETRDLSLPVPERKLLEDVEGIYQAETSPKLGDYLQSTNSCLGSHCTVSLCSVSLLSSIFNIKDIDDCLRSTDSSVSISLPRKAISQPTQDRGSPNSESKSVILGECKDLNESKGTLATANCSSFEEESDCQKSGNDSVTANTVATTTVETDSMYSVSMNAHESDPNSQPSGSTTFTPVGATFTLIESKDERMEPTSKLNELRAKIKYLREDCHRKIAKSRASLHHNGEHRPGDVSSDEVKNINIVSEKDAEKHDPLISAVDIAPERPSRSQSKGRKWENVRANPYKGTKQSVSANRGGRSRRIDIGGQITPSTLRKKSRRATRPQSVERSDKSSSVNSAEAAYHASTSVIQIDADSLSDSAHKRRGRRPRRSPNIQRIISQFDNVVLEDRANDSLPTARMHECRTSISNNTSLPASKQTAHPSSNTKRRTEEKKEIASQIQSTEFSYLQFLIETPNEENILEASNSTRNSLDTWKSMYSQEVNEDDNDDDDGFEECNEKVNRRRKSPRDTLLTRLSRYKNFRSSSLPLSPQKRTVRRFLRKIDQPYAKFEMPDEIGL